MKRFWNITKYIIVLCLVYTMAHASNLGDAPSNSELTVPYGGTGAVTLTDGGLLLGSGLGAVTPLGQATNGQLPIGSTGADPTIATLTGTANQISIANAAGSITLSTPQDIATTSAVTFLSVNDVYFRYDATGNISVGDTDTMNSITTGDYNTVMGYQAGTSIQGGDGNTVIGYTAGAFLSSTDDNVIIGKNAGYYQKTPEDCVMIGTSAGFGGVDAANHTLIGHNSGHNLRGGSTNTFIGWFSGMGKTALNGTTTGDLADHLIDAGEAFSTDDFVRVGMVVLNLDESTETTIAAIADGDLTLDADIFNNGGGAGGETYRIIYADGSFNVGIGDLVLKDVTDGQFNVAMGHSAGEDVRDGNYNVYLGRSAGEENISGDQNIFLGNYAGAKHTLSDRFIVDSRGRASEADEITDSILYGVMAAAPEDQILTINAAVNIGASAANRAQFAADGELTLAGTARVEKYMVIGAAAIQKGGTAPDTGTEGTFPTLLFASNLTEQGYFVIHIPGDWAVGTDLEVAVYWAPTSGAAGGVAWEFDWEAVAADANETLGAGSTHVDLHDATQSLDNELLETSYGDISGASLAVDDTIGILFYRDHDDATDNYGADAALIHIEVEYIADKLGSAT